MTRPMSSSTSVKIVDSFETGGNGYESEVSSTLGDNLQDDSDDSTATRIIEKSHLFQHAPKTQEVVIEIPVEEEPYEMSSISSAIAVIDAMDEDEPMPEPMAEPNNEPRSLTPEPQALLQEPEPEPEFNERFEEIHIPREHVRATLSKERPKTSIVAHENETIIVRRPRTAGSFVNFDRREFRLTLEIEPVDQITIKTPPKTPERLSLVFDLFDSADLTLEHSTFERDPISPVRLQSPALPALPPTQPISIPVSPAPEARSSPTPPPHSPGPMSPKRTKSPSRSRTNSPSLPFEDIPIVVNKMAKAKPIIPHFKSPEQQPVSDSTYESTTDTEQVPKKAKAPTKLKKKEKVSAKKQERPRDLIVNCFLKLQSTNWEETIKVILFLKF